MALATAVRSFRPARGRGPELWLVGVTHLGHRGYYGELQRLLDAQEVVLYEGVGATNRAFQQSRRNGYSLQEALARALGLEFQLDAIAYDRPHFRNSDLTVHQLSRIMKGETRPAADVSAPGGSGAGSSGAHEGREIDLLFEVMEGSGLVGGLARVAVSLVAASPRLQAALKVAMIELLGGLPDDFARGRGLPADFQRLLRVLIEERNAVVLHDLSTMVRTRRPPGSVAVLYGAGHMGDLETRIARELAYRPVSERWITALEVDPVAEGLTAFELGWVRRLVQAQLKGLAPASSKEADARR